MRYKAVLSLLTASLGLHLTVSMVAGQKDDKGKGAAQGIMDFIEFSNLEEDQKREFIDAYLTGVTADSVQNFREQNAADSFKGMGFGGSVGISFFSPSNRDQEAMIVDGTPGTVRITKERSVVPAVMLESHYFITRGDKPMWGAGPFAGILSSGEKVIDAFGIGLMIGGRRSKDQPQSFNLGLGVIWEPEIQRLGEGFEEGKAPPGNETEIRYKTEAAVGTLLIISFTF